MSSSVPEICRAAGLSTRQFYEEFTSREGLLLDLFARIHSEARSFVSQALRESAQEDARTGIAAGIAAYIHALADDPRRARLVLIESVGINHTVNRLRERERADWAVLIENAARARLPDGYSPLGGYHTAMTAYIGAVNAVVAEWAKGEPREPMDELTDVLVPLLMAVLGIE